MNNDQTENGDAVHSSGGNEGGNDAGNDVGNEGGNDEQTPGYADAMAELEQILRDLEGDDLDVDLLASRVERASSLIGLCRQRIGAARVQVERVVARLDSDDEAPIEAGADGDDPS